MNEFRAGYDKARALFPLLPPYYELNLVSDTALGHVRFMGLNSAGLPIFNYRMGSEVTELEAMHEAGHAYKALLEKKYPYRQFGQEYWDSRGFPGTYASAKQALVGLSGAAAWIADPNESWAEAFRIGVSLDAAPPDNEHTADYGKGIDPAGVRAFFRSLSPSAPSPVPPPPTEEVTLIDIRQQLPREDWSIGTFAPKTSVTVHWNGEPVNYEANPVNVAIADAEYHIAKNWGTTEDPAYGDGIMYHRLYAPDGQVFQTRDDDAVLWHCASPVGNAQSWAWQVMTGQGQTATQRQLDSLKRDLIAVGLPRKGHRDWSSTQCPGDQLYAFVHSDMGTSGGPKPSNAALLEEDDLFTDADRELLKRVKDILEAREPLVWAARSQRFLDVENGKAFDPNKPPADPRIKT